MSRGQREIQAFLDQGFRHVWVRYSASTFYYSGWDYNDEEPLKTKEKPLTTLNNL